VNIVIEPHIFQGKVVIPASKSHTIRRLLIASLAEGVSVLQNPLDSLDTKSCVSICRALGAQIEIDKEQWIVHGNGGNIFPAKENLDVGNSGTTLFLALAIASLSSKPITFTGDNQIEKRSARALIEALEILSVKTQHNNYCVPITVEGPINSGRISLKCPTSQYLSAMLLAAPLTQKGTVIEIDVPLLNEKPYIEMTLDYLKKQNIKYEAAKDFSFFKIEGGASYKTINGLVPGDFSSSAFPACASIISGGTVTLCNLDPNDHQGDKFFFDMLSKMGADVVWSDGCVTVSKKSVLHGGVFDLNATPDLLPAAAVLASYAYGETRLVNVAHARIKETDRIACMAETLTKFGVKCAELHDSLIIDGRGKMIGGSKSKPLVLDGKGDHRIVMAIAAAALGASGTVEITGAEASEVTYPGFFDLILKNDKLL
jgi:3-phosphoshikimate 1-carboxyvinyltransferase